MIYYTKFIDECGEIEDPTPAFLDAFFTKIEEQSRREPPHKKLFGQRARGIFYKRISTNPSMTLREIGNEYGLSPVRIHQIESKILRHLRRALINDKTEKVIAYIRQLHKPALKNILDEIEHNISIKLKPEQIDDARKARIIFEKRIVAQSPMKMDELAELLGEPYDELEKPWEGTKYRINHLQNIAVLQACQLLKKQDINNLVITNTRDNDCTSTGITSVIYTGKSIKADFRRTGIEAVLEVYDQMTHPAIRRAVARNLQRGKLGL